MAVDAAGNDLDEVRVPITGSVAVIPLSGFQMVSQKDGYKKPFPVPAGAKKVGLIS